MTMDNAIDNGVAFDTWYANYVVYLLKTLNQFFEKSIIIANLLIFFFHSNIEVFNKMTNISNNISKKGGIANK